MNKHIEIGPYLPHPERRTIFCMAGDEPLMFQPRKQLNEIQKKHVEFMKDDVMPFSMSMIPISKPIDVIVLDERFLNNKSIFEWHLSLYEKMGLSFSTNFSFTHFDNIYTEAFSKASNDDIVSIECFSHKLGEKKEVSEVLKASIVANSKIHLAENADSFALNIPQSEIKKKKELKKSPKQFNENSYFIKSDGLGGGFNVLETSSETGLQSFIEPFHDEWKFVIQEKVPAGTGMSIDMAVYPDSETIISTRRQLTKSNRYYGNVFNVRPSQDICRDLAAKVCSYLRSVGYASEHGYICGVDFIADENNYTIVDINARWTGGLPAALLLQKMSIDKNNTATFIYDNISPEHFSDYMALCEEKLYQPGTTIDNNSGYKIIPVAFCAHGYTGKYCVCYIVLGNYENFLIKRSW